MLEERLFIQCNDHEIPMVISCPSTPGPYPCVLLLHGFLSYKEGDGHLFTKTAQALSSAGIASARIDFCSMGENRYSRKHYGTRICMEETEAAFNFLQQLDYIQANRIAILGHSMGGRIAFLTSSLPSKCLITFNGAVNVDKPDTFKLKGLDEEEIKQQGYTIVSTSDGRCELIYQQFIDDIHIYSKDIYQYNKPILLCVGANDPTLDPHINYTFYQQCSSENVELLVIEDANHTFNAKTGDYTKVYELLEKVIHWLQIHL